jgi:peptidoglycan/LPS O-acetylase OafA/YrhL
MVVTSARRLRLDSLTGLRFFAALVVFGYHLLGFFYFTAPYAAMTHVFVQGVVGVSFFFVLSGFVLTWSHHRGDRAGAFYRRRVARIGPLHVATWLLMGIVLVAYATRPALWPATASLLLLAPWTPWLANHLTMNNPSWSLGCEAFFYALFPLLYALLHRWSPGRRRLLGLGAVVAALVVAVVASPAPDGSTAFWFVYFFPPVRLLEFVLGMLLALELADADRGLFAHRRLPFGAIGLLAVGAYVADSWAPTAYQAVVVTLVPFALLIVAAAQADQLGRPSVLRWRPLVVLGVWSFAFYLVHWAVLTVLLHEDPRHLGVLGGILNGVGALAACIVLAGLAHRAIERPLERLIRRGRQPRLNAEAPPLTAAEAT